MIKLNKTGKGGFKPGESGNKAGRPTGALGKMKTSQLEKLLEALNKIGEEKKEAFMDMVARFAYNDKDTMQKVLDKMVANRNYLTDKGDGSIDDVHINWELTENIENHREEVKTILEKVVKKGINLDDVVTEIKEELKKS